MSCFQTAQVGMLLRLADTLRVDELPKFAKSADDLLHLLFAEAKVDGLFTDFPDVA